MQRVLVQALAHRQYASHLAGRWVNGVSEVAAVRLMIRLEPLAISTYNLMKAWLRCQEMEASRTIALIVTQPASGLGLVTMSYNAASLRLQATCCHFYCLDVLLLPGPWPRSLEWLKVQRRGRPLRQQDGSRQLQPYTRP